MRFRTLFVAAAFAATSSLSVAGVAVSYRIASSGAACRCGEAVAFEVTALDADGASATEGCYRVILDDFGNETNGYASVDVARENPFSISGRLMRPGFLRLTVEAPAGGGACASVGYEPDRLVKGSPRPADFDAWWKSERERLQKEVPLDPQIERVPERSTAEFDYYRISFATFGRRVYGFMSVPTDRTKGPWPVEFQVSAAGHGDWTNCMAGESDRVRVFFSVYPWAPHWQWREKGLQARYEALNRFCQEKYGAERYCTAGIAEGRETYFFHPVLLGIDRAVDWLATRPEVDPARIRYEGTSQGGGFGFYLVGLNAHFSRAVFFVPAITDTMGYLAGRRSGWPRIIESQPTARRAAAERWAPYFDAANFASRIACPVRVIAGLSDLTCPPPAVHAAYNAISSSDRQIILVPGMTHGVFGEVYAKWLKWLND